MSYGINRVPADVDPTNEALAEAAAVSAAAAHAAAQATDWERHVLRNWRCSQCGSTEVNLTIQRSGLMGCAVMCERCFMEYHKGRGTTLAEIADWWAEANAEPVYCAVCHEPAAWNSGAGRGLCRRHWHSY